ncbi:maleylacetate reductase and hydroxyquinol 1,2-dioxygenase domain-containing protein [Rhodococcus sp. 14-2470-1a]|uniref:maleylacetate reductase and hydroxyquinol 1,2-dioxygenase domain-containing protein n=1 Tax=Rhodococcus sp. 14-2470-1a TaxID=2023150 RepID=UPI000B9C32E2|nr:maleylacetate reductase and hydroxyquinol 1,2-dioxygenase domain-containing protein [Rhodococcus sp. 14-2470-1a]OZF45953.1 alcohol dehydrogenase [Rhodococcus sp. 14-2470-1a]
MRTFTYTSTPARVLFGSGTAGEVAGEVGRLNRSRVLLVTGSRANATADTIKEALGSLIVAHFDEAAMHTPTEITLRAVELAASHDVDCVVAIGGGTTTGLAKALAHRAGYDQIIVPTTYSGSEVTPVLGETTDGVKTTRSSASILPETVIYDVDATLGLPRGLTVTSAINAMAHAVEALYSADSNPVTDNMALDAIAAIARSLPIAAEDPENRDARADLLQGAWLAGQCLAAVGMGLHHKLCHTLGGSFGLPHSPTHTVILPHAMAYNAAVVPEVMSRIAGAMRVPDAPAGVFDLVASLGGPTALADLGFLRNDIDEAARSATTTPYPNPRNVTTDGIHELLTAAFFGKRPGGGAAFPRAELDHTAAEVVESFDNTADTRLRDLLGDLVRHAHTFVTDNDVTEDEWRYAIDFLTATGQICSDTRQEFILLSDTLGISTTVDILTNSRATSQTPSAVLGPFYVEGPPETDGGSDIADGLPGTPLWVDLSVTDPAGIPVAGAVIDVWQSNKDGFYDVQLPDLEGPALRARFHSDDAGRLTFWTILPHEYPIPDDGPVGAMLAAAGRHPYRAPHVHFMITAPGYRKLITQLFPSDGSYLTSDTVFGVKESLIVDFSEHTGPTPDGRQVPGSWRRLDFDFHLAPES